MSYLLNALLMAGYAYLFRTQLADFSVAIKADWAWLKSLFGKPAAPAAPAVTAPTPPAAPKA